MSRIPSVAVALAVASTALGAQSDRATFYLIVGTDTVTVERVERTPAELRFQIYDRRGGGRVDFVGRFGPRALIESATHAAFVSGTDTVPLARTEVRFDADSVGVHRSGTMNWIRVGPGVLPGLNVSAALLEQSFLRARALGGDSASIPLMFLPAGPALPVTIVFQGDSAVARIAGVAIHAAVSPEGKLLGGIIPSQNARYVRGPALESAPLHGGYSPPAGAPYAAQDVTIRTPAGVTLRGTLTLPQPSPGARAPAIVTISGSGPQNRDGTIIGARAYRPFYQLADTLGRRGIAVLRLDDRGVGSDVGTPGFTTLDLADDVRAAVTWLRARPEIDPLRIGLVGHSEGGIIAPMIAESDSGIAGIVVMAGAVSKGRDILVAQQRYMVDSVLRLSGRARQAALAEYARNTDSVASALPWMRFFVDYEGAATAARVRAPVLILHGEKDYQVPVGEAEKIAAAMRAGGNRDVTVRVFPGLNHLFVPYGGPGFSYDRLPSYAVNPAVLGAIADWLSSRFMR